MPFFLLLTSYFVFVAEEPEAQVLWRVPDDMGLWLLGTQEEEKAE